MFDPAETSLPKEPLDQQSATDGTDPASHAANGAGQSEQKSEPLAEQELSQELQNQLRERRIERLFTAQLYLRWLFNLWLWLTVGTLSLWGLRGDIVMWLEYFTWAAVRASLRYNRMPFFGLALCVAMTLATLIWHSAHILWGMSPKERYYFGREVELIAAKGPKHWLWRWVCEEKI